MPRFWSRASGWEYEVLRLLPKATAKEIYARAFSQWRKRGLATRWFQPLLFLIAFGFIWFLLLVSIALEEMGCGEVTTILVVLGVVTYCHFWAFQRILPKVLRPFVREQLYLIARARLPAAPQLEQFLHPQQWADECE